ncbi:cytochrome P450 [Sphingobium boeckii]|uniref:Cytochrome P450 n=1 Tax=Sphingobium boeckii TaxID=1082345 RepID=A0A7W9ALE2_9SPHN|nr:cytochrome P450 [Sphingobium boeckii]
MNQALSELLVPDHVPRELVIDFDAASDVALTFDIFKRMDELRNSSPPIAYSPHGGGHWLLFREKDILKAFSDGDHFSTSLFNAGAQEGAPDMIPLCLDPPEHLPWRMTIVRHLTPTKMRRLEDFIRQKAESLITPLVGQKSCDFVSAVAEPMPISIFMALMGLPAEGFDEFRSLALQIISPEGNDRNTPATAAANARILAILSELIEARRLEPKDDLVSALIDEKVKGEAISAKGLLSICYVLFLGGLDTVVNAMSYGMRYLAQQPELQDEARAGLVAMPDLVEKLLRKSAFVNPMRIVKQDVEIEGVTLKAGDLVWSMCWPASNEPGGDGEGQKHLTFGGGHHLCAGMHLARLELRIMYETWFRYIGPFALAPDVGPTMTGGSTMLIKRLLLNLQP